MTREETKMILEVIDNVYPNWHPKDPVMTVNVWSTLFKNFEYKDVGEALRRYMMGDKNGFAPVPGQLIDILYATEDEQDYSDMSAWSMVRKAISNGGYNSKEEFEKLPPLVRRAVGNSDNIRNWAMMDVDSVESVVQSNFLRSYRAILSKAQERRRYMMIDPEHQIAEKAPEAIEDKSMVDIILDMKRGEKPDMTNEFTRRLYEKFGDKFAEGTA